jgi:hypothetical protein
MKINILDEASAELDDAFQYYEYEQENLGYRFISKFTDALELIKFYPNGWHCFIFLFALPNNLVFGVNLLQQQL